MMNNLCEQLIQASIHKTLSSKEEKVVLEYLKSIPEAEAYKIIESMRQQKSLITLVMAKKVLHTKDYVKNFFKDGITNCDAQTIKLWLGFAVPKLGFRSVAKQIEQFDNGTNRLIEKAIYWLPMFISENDQKSQCLLEHLKEKVKSTDMEDSKK